MKKSARLYFEHKVKWIKRKYLAYPTPFICTDFWLKTALFCQTDLIINQETTQLLIKISAKAAH